MKNLAKINKLEIGFLGINAILAGSGTAAGFTFTTLGALTVLLNLTGTILAFLSIGGIVVFGILMLAVAFYFFNKNFHSNEALTKKIETTEKRLAEKMLATPINTTKLTNTDLNTKLSSTNHSSLIINSPKLLACVNFFINFGCSLGPCLGLIGAISSIGIIAGISAIALPILLSLVLTATALAIVATYGVYYCENRNNKRQNLIASMNEQIKCINTNKNLILTEPNNQEKFYRSPLPRSRSTPSLKKKKEDFNDVSMKLMIS